MHKSTKKRIVRNSFDTTTKKTSRKYSAKKTAKRTSDQSLSKRKKVAKKAVKNNKECGGRQQIFQTNAERIVLSTCSNGEQRAYKVPRVEKDTLRIIPIGGQEEVGRNMIIFEYGKDIVVVDMGMQFPEEDMPGIDYIVPNVNYLKGKEQNIRGVTFTHGHLDHIGAVPVLLKQLGYPPIIARDLTLALIKKKIGRL